MKRIFSCILIVTLLLTCCGNVLAADVEMQSSTTLSTYNVKIAPGSSSGSITFIFDVTSTRTASLIGISTVKIYKSNGSYVTTVYGTTTNGLMAKNSIRKAGTYSYSGVSGTSYYAIVTFTATVNGVTDSKTVTTNTATAP